MAGMITGEQIVAAARGYVGTPFKLYGRDKNGIDCLGLIVCVAREVDRRRRTMAEPEEELRNLANAVKLNIDRLVVLIEKRDHEAGLGSEEIIYPSAEKIGAQVNS